MRSIMYTVEPLIKATPATIDGFHCNMELGSTVEPLNIKDSLRPAAILSNHIERFVQVYNVYARMGQ